MATDVTDLTAQLNALRIARHAGYRRIRFGDREVEYRSDAELATAIASLERQIEAATGKPAATIHFATRKGL